MAGEPKGPTGADRTEWKRKHRAEQKAKKQTKRARKEEVRLQPDVDAPGGPWTSPPTHPEAVIAAPLYNGAEYLAKAVDSLLGQSFENFALILVDDASTDETPEIAQRYAERDARVFYFRNRRRRGMIGNKRRCFSLARKLFPTATYFAWGSDHDVWRPAWLDTLIETLSESPNAVCAYPKSIRIDERGKLIRSPWEFDTAGITDRAKRLDRAVDRLASGYMVYGLYRADAMARVGVMRRVLEPDRLLLLELALHGEFVQAPFVLWERRFAGLASPARQRASLFARRPPLHAYLAPWRQHAWKLFWLYAVLGKGKPAFGRRQGLELTREFLRATRAMQSRREQDVEEKARQRAGAAA